MDSCEYGNKMSGFIKVGEILSKLSTIHSQEELCSMKLNNNADFVSVFLPLSDLHYPFSAQK
jgi:hypothetical protein